MNTVNTLLDLNKSLPEALADIERGQIVTGYELYNAEYPDPTFLFEGLLANGLTILAGRPKSGKSWLTLQIAVCAAGKVPFLGRFPIEQAARVLYCALEEPKHRTNRRLRKLLTKNDISLQNIGFLYHLRSLADGGADELHEHLVKRPSELVVIDTLLAIAGNSGRRDVMRAEYAEVNLLRQLALSHKNAFVLVAHTRKMGAEAGLDMVAGTSGITAACDAVWTLRKQNTGNSILEMTGREMEELTLALKLDTGDPFGWQLIGEGSQVALSEQRQEILELLKGEGALLPKTIATMLRKNAVTVRRHLQNLSGGGEVVKGADGKYTLAKRSPATVGQGE